MSPNPLFHFTSALKRNRKITNNPQQWQPDGRDTKAQHILGISQADISIARNQSITSTTSTRGQQKSFSDATTDLGYSLPSDGRAPQIPELQLKASSVLLHDEFIQRDSESTRSNRLRNQRSSSTLNSYYDPSKAPLSISQQTSDSSRRDFALRKGNPMVVTTITPEKDSLRQFRLLRGSRRSSSSEKKKLSKSRRPSTSAAPAHKTNMDWRPDSGHESVASFKSMHEAGTQSFQVTRFVPRGATGVSSQKTIRAKNSLLGPLDPACVKVNVRRPKIGTKHWFDGHEGDTSEEEFVDEPELEPTFASSMEFALKNDQIKSDPSRCSIDEESRFAQSSMSTPRAAMISAVPPRQDSSPRIAGLSAKASKSSLAMRDIPSEATSTKQKMDPFAGANLNENSVMSFSSSDDENDEIATPKQADVASPRPNIRNTGGFPRPAVRDSVASAFHQDSQIEVGTAKTVSAQVSSLGRRLTQVKKLQAVSRTGKGQPLRMPVPKRGSSLMLSYLNMQAEKEDNQGEIIDSFPATPTGSDGSNRFSLMTSGGNRMSFSLLSDAGSMESRRMMSVTRQEESLLAAMRLKKANMHHNTTLDKRREALRNLEKSGLKSPPGARLSMSEFDSQVSLGPKQPTENGCSPYENGFRGFIEDDSPSRTSGTTFQTHTTRDFSHNMSRATFQTANSFEPNTTRLSLSSDSQNTSASPSLLSLAATDRRTSRNTYFSSSSTGYMGHSRTATATSHIVALDDLDKVPGNRDEIPSQEFIDWPYRGWNKRASLGVAH